MKHFRLLFLTVVLSAVCATASAQRVTLDMQNAKLEKVLGQITQHTYAFRFGSILITSTLPLQFVDFRQGNTFFFGFFY